MPTPPYLADEDEDIYDPDEEELQQPPVIPAAGYGGFVPGQSSPISTPLFLPQPQPIQGPPPVDQDYAAAQQRLAQIQAQQPIPTKPKWWQLAAAGLVGGMAGEANAASRMRRPIDATAATQGILQPGLGLRTAEWQRQLQGAQAQAQAAANTRQAWYQGQELQQSQELRQAQADYYKERGGYYAARGAQEQNAWKIDPKTGNLYNTLTGETRQRAATLKDRFADAKGIGMSDADARVYAAGGKIGTTTSKEVANPAQVLLNPKNYTPEQVDQARKLFAQEHRDPNAVGPTGNVPLRNPTLPPTQRDDQLLSSQDPGVQSVVKQLVDYKYPLPSGIALSKPYWQNILQLAAQYDPTFDAANYSVRQKVRADFTSGKSSQAINALNTVAQHIDQLEKNWKDLNNMGGARTILNAPFNAVSSRVSGDMQRRMNRFQLDQEAVANELMRTWRQVGANESEIKSWASKLSPNLSPEAQQGAIQEIYELIHGKLAALKNQYEQAMGRPADFKMLQGDTAKRFEKHGVDPTDLAPNATYANVPQQNAPQQAGPQASGNDMVNVQIPGVQPGQVHRSQLQRFLADHPGAKILQ